MSDNNGLAGTFTFNKAVNPKIRFDKHCANEYVACYYDWNWWTGLVQNVNCDEKNVEINFLHPPGPSNSFTRPKKKDGYHIWIRYVKSDLQQHWLGKHIN